jgi:hypothetical protein
VVGYLHAAKSYDIGSPFLLPFRKKVYCGFLSPLKSIALAVFEPANLGYNGKHDNHYTTQEEHRKLTYLVYSADFASE